MLKLACVVLLAVAVAGAPADLLDGTELVLTFLVHRHGDRTPIDGWASYSNDPEKLVELSEPYGYGQLTNVGKRRGYQLGQSIRTRYNDLIAPQYNRSEVYIRSTDSTRAKMTILSALAAIYPPLENIWDDINWTPVPYTTAPPLYDFNLAYANCPAFIKNYNKLMVAPSKSMTNTSRKISVLSILSKHSGVDLLQSPGLAYAVYDVYTSQISLGIPVDPEIQAIWPEVEKIAGEAVEVAFGDKNFIALQAGVLLNEFYKAACDIISGVDSTRVRIYSAHDFNVFSLIFVTKIVNKQGVPKYGSAYALELRRVMETDKYVVVPVYLPSPGEDFIHLEVEGCGTVCDYQQFVDITSEYALDEDTWRTKCGWTKDIYIDDSTFA
ncbi:hypothetical protein ABMA27_003421 [Loxostege sticticalis]|uniref:acid phosphatase n=1 Tax=Loxostege sticticalis TaxID=481309 RepID=A0ABR3HT16_LOXSC